MSVLLVKLRGPQYYKTSGPDLGLGFLATALKRRELSVDVIDLTCHSTAFLRSALHHKRYDAVGFKLYSKDISDFKKVHALLRAELPGNATPLIAGGPLPTGLGEETLRVFPEFTYAFHGEAENGFAELAAQLHAGNRLSLSDIPGLIYREGDAVRMNAQDFPPDLDALGFPDYSSTPPHLFPPDYTTGDVYVTAMTSRGCPYHCTYCGGPLLNGHRLRLHGAQYVVDYIERLQRNYRIRSINFVDDNLTCRADHARAIFELMIRRNINIAWRAPNGIRLDTLDRDLIQLMERSGCRELYLGIESGSPRVLNDMQRQVTVERYREKVALLADNSRIRLLGFFILGYPTEREEDARQSLELALSLPLHRAAFFFFTPHPGTAIYREMKNNNELPDDIWNSLFYDRPTLGSRHITLERLKRIQRAAYLRFYLRPRIIWDLLKSVESWQQFVRLLQKILGTWLRF